MPENDTADLIHFQRTDGSLMCGRLLSQEAGSTLNWGEVACPNCWSIRRARSRRTIIWGGSASAVTVVVVAVIAWFVLSGGIGDWATYETPMEPIAANTPTVETVAHSLEATAAPSTPTATLADVSLTDISPTVEHIESSIMTKPRRGARLKWVEESSTLHHLVDAENPDDAIVSLKGQGNCWNIIGADGARQPGACTAFGTAQGNARTYANQALACPPEQPMCVDPEYIFVQWMRSMVSITSGGSITVATDCADETLIEIKESIFGFGGPRTENYHSYMVPAGYYEQRYQAPTLSSGGSVNHRLQPRVAGVGECWIGFRE